MFPYIISWQVIIRSHVAALHLFMHRCRGNSVWHARLDTSYKSHFKFNIDIVPRLVYNHVACCIDRSAGDRRPCDLPTCMAASDARTPASIDFPHSAGQFHFLLENERLLEIFNVSF